MSKKRLGILRGGLGSEYDISLKTGENVLNNLAQNPDYELHDILITKDGTWHHRGLPVAPGDLPERVDLIFNALHGDFGEDGEVQNILDDINLPYTGVGRESALLTINKDKTKELLKDHGILTPYGLTLEVTNPDDDALAYEVFSRVSPPWVIKPVNKGSSVGVYQAFDFPNLRESIKKASRFSSRVLVEEFIRGREATCGLIEDFRNNKTYTLPVSEILKSKDQPIWNYEDKYSGATNIMCPATFLDEEKYQIQEIAKRASEVLGLRHYCRADFILSPRGVYLLEINSLPDLSPNSTFVKSFESIGLEAPQFLDHIVKLASRDREDV